MARASFRIAGSLPSELRELFKQVEDAINANAPLEGSATFDPSSLADGAGETTMVTVQGAKLGQFASASFSVALAGITVTAWVSADDTVSVRFQNESGGVVDLASGTLRARVFKV